jgi:hypothetical protein
MSSGRDDRNERLRAILRRGDPGASDAGPSREEIAWMRQTVLRGAETSRAPGAGFRLAAGGALAALVLMAGLALWRSDPGRPAGSGADRAVRSAGPTRRSEADPAERRAVRVIHFVTPGGTRVVWSLDPEFDV